MQATVDIIGAGLAGSEAALQLAARGIFVRLFEMRPFKQTSVHTGGFCAELVCSNSLKSLKETSAAGMLKKELLTFGSKVLSCAYEAQVPAGKALAVDRSLFSSLVAKHVRSHPNITYYEAEVLRIGENGALLLRDAGHKEPYFLDTPADALIIASGPLTSDTFASFLSEYSGCDHMAFYDAAAPIVLADSLDLSKVFSQSRYEQEEVGDYLNAPFTEEEYKFFIKELLRAECVIKRSFETKELFQACQPIEELARRGEDAPRFGPLKPVGLIDPQTQKRPWAALQLRKEDVYGQSYNLVGFQTNLTFSEQKRVFRLIPGLEKAEFARYGVMHRNTFIDAPKLLDSSLRFCARKTPIPMFVAGQLGGTEGYCEAIASGLVAALGVVCCLSGIEWCPLPGDTAFGALVAYATDYKTNDYQPMHVNFGLMAPLDAPIKNKRQRYIAYAQRGEAALKEYKEHLCSLGIVASESR